jgi:phosphoribosylformylglycinamidine synthase
LRFACRYVHLRVENAYTPFTSQCADREVLSLPIAHGDGNYFADDATIRRLERNGQVVFRYCTPEGEVTAESNPNGSLGNIAGITNEQGNVLGMMPHPERAADALLGHTDGHRVFASILEHVFSRTTAASQEEAPTIVMEQGRR